MKKLKGSLLAKIKHLLYFTVLITAISKIKHSYTIQQKDTLF